MNFAPGSVDLHAHSTASDGSLAPDALLSAAASAGVGMLSITDHDTVAAYQAGLAPPPGMTLVPGIELSTFWRRIGIHVVGLGIDIDSSAMREACARQQAAREQRARAIAARLARRGIEDAYAGAARLADGGVIGRPHFARLLVERGVVRTLKQAYAHHLRGAREAHGIGIWAELGEVIDWIRDAGGVAVLAHPAHYRLTGMRLDELVGEFAARGGHAIEIVSGQQLPALTTRLAALARAHGLAGSLGSDFHHPDRTHTRLGRLPALPADVPPVWSRWTA
jgi:hypothetical protein